MVLVPQAIVTAPRFFSGASRYRGAVYDATGALVPASVRPGNKKWKSDNPASIKVDANLPVRLDGKYLGCFFPHFGHFLLETLTALHHAAGDHAPLYFHEWIPQHRDGLLDLPYVKPCLDALGVAPERIVFVDETIRVAELGVPDRGDPMSAKPETTTLDVYRRVGDAALSIWPDTGARRVYLSRRLWRHKVRVTNETAIERVFYKAGFRIVYPEQLAFMEQVALVRRADVVAGVNGTALHLTAFMAPGTRVVSIGRGPQHNVRAIADMLGIETKPFSAGNVKPPSTETGDSVFEVDIAALRAALADSGYVSSAISSSSTFASGQAG